MKLLKTMGYLSLIVVLLSFLFFATEDLLSSLPFIVNAIVVYLAVKGEFRSKELVMAGSALMLVVNIAMAVTDPIALVDVVFWAVNIYAWNGVELIA